MYAEIKANNKILINRLDDSERILLEDIYNQTKQENAVINITNLTDEYGDFGGIMLEVTQEEPEPEESVEAPEEEELQQ